MKPCVPKPMLRPYLIFQLSMPVPAGHRSDGQAKPRLYLLDQDTLKDIANYLVFIGCWAQWLQLLILSARSGLRGLGEPQGALTTPAGEMCCYTGQARMNGMIWDVYLGKWAGPST